MNDRQKRYRATAKGKAKMLFTNRRYRNSARSRMAVQAKSLERYRAVREFVDSIKRRPCADCGRTYDTVCMDFDHRPGEVKKFLISQTLHKRGMPALLREIAKCDVVCANCHRLRTYRGRSHKSLTQKPCISIDQLPLPLGGEK